MTGLSLAILGLWVILQTTKGPLAEKLGLLVTSSGPAGAQVTPGPANAQGPNPSAWQPADPPPGAPPGKYRVDQNGNWEELVGGVWLPFSLGSHGYA